MGDSFCQVPADVMIKLYYSSVYFHMSYASPSCGRPVRSNAAKIDRACRRVRKLLTDSSNYQLNLRLHSFIEIF